MREISQGCAFWGFRQKVVTPTPTNPQIPKIMHYKSRFLLNTHINLVVSATKIRSRIGNSPWGFQIFGKKFDRKLNSGRFYACTAENWLKMHEIVVQFPKFLTI